MGKFHFLASHVSIEGVGVLYTEIFSKKTMPYKRKEKKKI